MTSETCVMSLSGVQAVDMRWGVRDDAADDHTTTSLCMEEIDNCRRLSVGTNFLVSRKVQVYFK